MDLHLQSFALRGFVDQIAREWRKPFAESGSEFRLDCADDLGEVVGDSAKLSQAVGSLLSNAAKYAKGSSVTLAVSNRDGQIAMAVRDTGPGMKPDQMVNLFEAFGKQEGETSSIYRETPGLGLPLSQRLCRLMEGDLTADSEPGRGSCFTIRVPSHVVNRKGPGTAESDLSASSEPLGVS